MSPPREAIEKAREAMEAEYPESEFESFEPKLMLKGEEIADSRAGDVRFYYLDLLVISRLIAFTVNKKTYLIQIQAEDRDFDQVGTSVPSNVGKHVAVARIVVSDA